MIAEVISIDAWHDPFKLDDTTSGVYVEVTFQKGRMGGNDPELDFTFNIGLKRALLTVTVEKPLQIKKSSVARNVPAVATELTRIIAAKELAKRSASAKGEVSLSAFTAALSGGMSAEREVSRDDQLKVVQQIPRIVASARPRADGEYSWDLQPSYEELLEGQPWNPVEAARFHVRHPRERPRIDPVIRVNLSCALEDIVITDIEAKPAGLVETVLRSMLNEVSYAAAVQYLKQVLVNADLEVGKIDNRFSDLLLASVLSKEEF